MCKNLKNFKLYLFSFLFGLEKLYSVSFSLIISEDTFKANTKRLLILYTVYIQYTCISNLLRLDCKLLLATTLKKHIAGELPQTVFHRKEEGHIFFAGMFDCMFLNFIYFEYVYPQNIKTYIAIPEADK